MSDDRARQEQAGKPVDQVDVPQKIHRGPYPELTWPAVIVGWLLGCLIAISIGYASLVLGFSIEGSELAAILGWGLLRGVLRRTSILENNINQTIASAVNGASAGMMFSIPALFILSTPTAAGPSPYVGLTDFSKPLMVLSCITGGVLGLAFVIPLRRQMIDFDRLAYPGGIAVATILKSPGAGMRKAMLLLAAALLSAVVYLLVLRQFGDDEPVWQLGTELGWASYLNITLFLSLMTVGVGFLSGRGGFWFGAGGFLCYWFLSPLLAWTGSPAVQQILHEPDQLQSELFRPTGIGMLIGAAIGGIIAALPLILSAVHSLHDASRQSSRGEESLHDEMPVSLLYGGVLGGAITLVLVAYWSVGSMTVDPAASALMALLGTLWVWVAGVIVSECVGRTNWSPLSGMTLIAVTILIFLARGGLDKSSTILSSVILGAAICVAIAQAGDMMLDLKSGFLVGAVPRRQQLAQFIGMWLGPIVVIVLIFALQQQYGLGSDRLPAPQGAPSASMVQGIVGQNVPTYRYVAGGGLGPCWRSVVWGASAC